jgi:multisubunit Na+/H+ antiporter MnhC subunit
MMRLIFVLLVIAAMVLLGLYLLYDDKKYLQYFKKLIKYSLYLAMVAAVLFLLRRIFYV